MENSSVHEKATGYELFPDELPDPDSVPSLEVELRKGARERLMNRKLEAQQRRAEKRPSVPTVYKLVHPSPQKYKKCQHSENFILDREVLKPLEHIGFIALPRQVVHQKRPHFVEHKLSSATNRIKTLARPGTAHVKNTLEYYSTQLSSKQQQHLQSYLEPKPFVSIQESIGYARQQRSDDAMWRRHRAKQERKLLHRIHGWEIKLLKQTMHRLSKCLKDFYLYASLEPLEEEAAQISQVVQRRISRLLETSIPRVAPQDSPDGNDVIEDFYVEFSAKVGQWIWRLMKQTGITFDKQKSFSYARKSESFVSVSSSIFQIPCVGATTTVEGELEPLSILSLELVYDCMDDAVLRVEQGSLDRRDSVCMEVAKANSAVDTMQEVVKSQSNESLPETDVGDTIDARASIQEGSQEEDETDIEDQVTVIEKIVNDEAKEEYTNPNTDEEPENDGN
uniref:Uncharacterized protein n=1 Tax=Anopheles epiroticus TaxID=199890 RepID=A0A182PXY3_9DIPT